MEITHVQIPVNLINATLGYLQKRPFDEVYDLIVSLKKEAEASFAEQQATDQAAASGPGR